LALANEKLWLAILIFAEDNSPAFRHAVLLRGISAGAEQVEDLVISPYRNAKRFYRHSISSCARKAPAQAIAEAMIDPVGEA